MEKKIWRNQSSFVLSVNECARARAHGHQFFKTHSVFGCDNRFKSIPIFVILSWNITNMTQIFQVRTNYYDFSFDLSFLIRFSWNVRFCFADLFFPNEVIPTNAFLCMCGDSYCKKKNPGEDVIVTEALNFCRMMK